MSYENAKLALSGGLVSPRFYAEIFKLAGTETPQLTIDLSPRPTKEKFDGTKALWQTVAARLGLPAPTWLRESFDRSLDRSRTSRLLDAADVLVVSGGGTRQAYAKWQAAGITGLIMERVLSGSIVAAGSSAGSMIWFAKGYSDSSSYEVPAGSHWEYETVQATGLFNAYVTAHYSDVDMLGRLRSDGFKRALHTERDRPTMALGIDTHAALLCEHGLARVIDIRGRQGGEASAAVHIGKTAGRIATYAAGSVIPLERFAA